MRTCSLLRMLLSGATAWAVAPAERAPLLSDARHAGAALTAPCLTTVGINIDPEPAKAQAMVQRLGLSIPRLLDRQGIRPGRFGIKARPSADRMDHRGIMRLVHQRNRTRDFPSLQARLAQWLKEPVTP